MPWHVEILASALVGGGYSIAVAFLLRPKSRFDPTLASMHDLVLLLVVAVVSAAFVAGRLRQPDDCRRAVAGLLISRRRRCATGSGDVIGITVIAPFALFALTRRRILPMTTETLLQFIADRPGVGPGFRSRRGTAISAVLCSVPADRLACRAHRLGRRQRRHSGHAARLILGIQLFPAGTFDVTAFQALMLVLAMTGLFAGELVTERRRTEAQLRLQQDSHSRLARLGSMGELAAAVAHELNQPLMAAGTYTRLVNDAMSTAPVDVVTVAETAKKLWRRSSVPLKSSATCAHWSGSIAAIARRADSNVSWKRQSNLCQPDLDRMHVTVRTSIAADLPRIMVDLLQIEQVLINLLRNAIEAIS
jgi:signal transduction histidine kinase